MPTIRLNLDTNRACKIAYSKSHENKSNLKWCHADQVTLYEQWSKDTNTYFWSI